MNIEAVRQSCIVPISPEDAFDLFTAKLGTWWPLKTHSLSGGAGSVEWEPGVEGRIIETLEDGKTAIWGHVTVWTPPRLVKFDWYVGRGPDEATQVVVSFEPAPEGTKVTVLHDGFEVLGEKGPELAENYRSGWIPVLDSFKSVC